MLSGSRSPHPSLRTLLKCSPSFQGSRQKIRRSERDDGSLTVAALIAGALQTPTVREGCYANCFTVSGGVVKETKYTSLAPIGEKGDPGMRGSCSRIAQCVSYALVRQRPLK